MNSQKKDTQKLLENSQYAAEMLKGMAHNLRLLMICHIGAEEKSVLELAEYLGTSQSNVSQHLAKLRNLGILNSRRAANQIFYSVKNPEILELIKTMQKVFCRF